MFTTEMTLDEALGYVKKNSLSVLNICHSHDGLPELWHLDSCECLEIQQEPKPTKNQGVIGVRCALCNDTTIIINRRAHDPQRAEFCHKCMQLPEHEVEAILGG